MAFATAAPAVVVPGGGKKKTDCFAGFEVDGTTNSSTVVGKGATTVDQKACDMSCTFTVSLCINEPVAGCTASAVSGFTFKPPSATLPLPVLGGSDHVCGYLGSCSPKRAQHRSRLFVRLQLGKGTESHRLANEVRKNRAHRASLIRQRHA